MRIFTPRSSFLKLILAGFALVALPLTLSLVHATFYVDRLADQSQRAVQKAVQATQWSWMLVEHVTAMERSARQFVVLGDDSLLEGYTKQHYQFRDTAGKLNALRLDSGQRGRLQELSALEDSIFETLSREPHTSPLAQQSIDNFPLLMESARAILAGSSRLINREVDVMQQIATHAQRTLALETLSVIPVALLLAAAFTFLIARPIRQIDTAIHQMGSGNFTGPVAVSGPADLKNLGERLNWLRLRLTELEAQRTKFLRQVSHELKTPLAALREGSALLADQVVGKLGGQQLEIARILQQSALQLQKRIEDLLNFSVAHQQTAPSRATPVALDDAIREVAVSHKPALLGKSLVLDMELAHVVVPGDQEKLVAVIDNLFSNAIKYSPAQGTVQVRLHEERGLAVLDVVDQGPGIPPAEQQRVFEPFYQGTAAREHRVEGTGLGLAIAREFVTTHHGSIEVAARQEPGAHLRVVLPTELTWSIQ